MASAGQAKLSRIASQMANSCNASKGRAALNYSAVGFGPPRNAGYQTGLHAAQYRAPDPNKWATNRAAKMRE